MTGLGAPYHDLIGDTLVDKPALFMRATAKAQHIPNTTEQQLNLCQRIVIELLQALMRSKVQGAKPRQGNKIATTCPGFGGSFDRSHDLDCRPAMLKCEIDELSVNLG